MDGGTAHIEMGLRSNPLLFEMLRSFATLAETLNLSHAVKELGSTRQTVRRHITQLEQLKGGALFDVSDRQYRLSDLGREVLPEALDLLSRANAWLLGQSSLRNGMQYLCQTLDDGWFFFQQQHPIGRAFSSTGEMLPEVLRAWAAAGGDIEHEEMRIARPQCMIFRRSGETWVFTEVGEKSSFISWYGDTIARSTIGRALGQMPGGASFDRLATTAYSEVESSQSVRLDHCYTAISNGIIGEILPICYERLLLGSRFADGSFAMVSAVRRTYDVEIDGVTDEMLRRMPEEFLM